MKFKEFREERILPRDAAMDGKIGAYAKKWKVGQEVDYYEKRYGEKYNAKVKVNTGRTLILVSADVNGEFKGKEYTYEITNDPNMT